MIGSNLVESKSKQQYGEGKGVAGQQPPPSLQQREEKESDFDKPSPRQQPAEPAASAITSAIEIENTACSQNETEAQALFISEVGKLNTTSKEQEGMLTSIHDDSSSSDHIVGTHRPSVATTPIGEKQQSVATPITPDCDRTYKITVTTASSSCPASIHSTMSSITDIQSGMSTIHTAYQPYKQTKSRSPCPCLSSDSSLHDIIEDIQFCGMYFMKELFDDEDADGDDDDDEEESQNKISKVERVKETNESFLGKMIQCKSTRSIDDRCGNSDDESSVQISRNLDLFTTIEED